MKVKNGIPFYLNLSKYVLLTLPEKQMMDLRLYKREIPWTIGLELWEKLNSLWSALFVSESLVSDIVLLNSLNISFQINTVNHRKKYQYLYVENDYTFLDISKLPMPSQKRISVLLRKYIYIFTSPLTI